MQFILIREIKSSCEEDKLPLNQKYLRGSPVLAGVNTWCWGNLWYFKQGVPDLEEFKV